MIIQILSPMKTLYIHTDAVQMRVLVNTSSEKEFILIAIDEGFTPKSFLNDRFCEELSHPLLFSIGKFRFQFKRKVELPPSNYFNQRLLDYAQKLSSDLDYICFAHSVIQKLNLNNEINIL